MKDQTHFELKSQFPNTLKITAFERLLVLTVIFNGKILPTYSNHTSLSSTLEIQIVKKQKQYNINCFHITLTSSFISCEKEINILRDS